MSDVYILLSIRVYILHTYTPFMLLFITVYIPFMLYIIHGTDNDATCRQAAECRLVAAGGGCLARRWTLLSRSYSGLKQELN